MVLQALWEEKCLVENSHCADSLCLRARCWAAGISNREMVQLISGRSSPAPPPAGKISSARRGKPGPG